MTPATLPVWTAWTTLAVLLMYCWLIYNVGRARMKFGIAAPVTDGPPLFLNVLRVHANTVEQIVVFLPALWLCAWFAGDRVAAAGGAVWLIGRVMYAIAYYADAAKRGPGFTISVLATFALIGGAAVGLMSR